MVRIRARSSLEVKQLRRMNLDITRVRPDPSRPPSEELLSGGSALLEPINDLSVADYSVLPATDFNVGDA
jgi:hypothetical protein